MAYTKTDSSRIALKLAPGWKMTSKKEEQGVRKTLYENLNDRREQMLLYAIYISEEMRKANSPAQIIQQVYGGVVQSSKASGCKVSELNSLEQNSKKFSVWQSSATCASLRNSHVLLYVDADVNTIYALIYVGPQDPLSGAELTERINSMKNALRLCYKDGNCQSLD